MGNAPSVGKFNILGQSSSPLPITQLDPNWVALCFQHQGIYAVDEDGRTVKLSEDNWRGMGACCRLSEKSHTLAGVGGFGCYKIDMRTGNFQKINKEKWRTVGFVLAIDDHTLLIGCATGIFSMPLTPGGVSTKLNDHNCAFINGVVYDSSTRSCVLFTTTGAYKFNVDDRSHEKLGKTTWATARGAVLGPDGRAFVFCDCGTFKVDLETGDQERVTSDHWGGLKGAVLSNDGNSAFAIYRDGTHKVSLVDGSSQKMPAKDTWHTLAAWCPLGAHACASSAIVAEGSTGGLVGAGVI